MNTEKNRTKRRDKKRRTKMVVHNSARKLAEIKRDKLPSVELLRAGGYPDGFTTPHPDADYSGWPFPGDGDHSDKRGNG
jgi:hypothetical protein